MKNTDYCDILDVCDFLAKHRMAPITAYGRDLEMIMGADGLVKNVPAPKPATLFRGQSKEYDTLRPTIYRGYPPLSTWQETRTVQLDEDVLQMPIPHYNEDLERDYYFSCVKAFELVRDVAARFPDFPEEVDGHALCQHYGLRTHCLDFSHDVWVSGFFATHSYSNGDFSPVGSGVGVMYVLEAQQVPPGTLYEIGFQPLPRPFAQKGFLLRVPPEVNLLAIPAVWSIYFQHSLSASEALGKRFDSGRALVPHDQVSSHIEQQLAKREVTKEGIAGYLNRVPEHHRSWLSSTIKRLFRGHIPVH